MGLLAIIAYRLLMSKIYCITILKEKSAFFMTLFLNAIMFLSIVHRDQVIG